MEWDSNKFVEAIKEGKIVTVSEREAHEEELFILREHHETVEPQKEKLPEPQWKLRRQSQQPKIDVPMKTLPKWQSYQPEYRKNNVVKDLIDNFQWEIAKARKAKNLTRLQLANALGVAENHIKIAENGELPSDDFIFINKLQNYLGINLRRDGKSFDTPMSSMPKEVRDRELGPAYVSKLNPDTISLADLQKRREAQRKASAQGHNQSSRPSLRESKRASNSNFTGSDIELIE